MQMKEIILFKKKTFNSFALEFIFACKTTRKKQMQES